MKSIQSGEMFSLIAFGYPAIGFVAVVPVRSFFPSGL